MRYFEAGFYFKKKVRTVFIIDPDLSTIRSEGRHFTLTTSQAPGLTIKSGIRQYGHYNDSVLGASCSWLSDGDRSVWLGGLLCKKTALQRLFFDESRRRDLVYLQKVAFFIKNQIFAFYFSLIHYSAFCVCYFAGFGYFSAFIMSFYITGYS